MTTPCDTKDSTTVELYVERTFASLYPDCGLVWLQRVFRDVELFFRGGHPDYAAIDVGYHDLEHTLQATLCLTSLLEGRTRADTQPPLDARHFELAVASALLHDCGYLKLRSDRAGTGAKYTFCHVIRSCAFAASYLPTVGADDYEVESVLAAINCTGPSTEVSRLHFRQPVEREVGCALGTADFLSQMADPRYVAKLEVLYEEFRESDEFLKIPVQRRAFASAAELVARTPAFWRKWVLPKLESEFQAAYRFLAQPFPHGPNPYLAAVEANMAEIERRLAHRAGATDAVHR